MKQSLANELVLAVDDDPAALDMVRLRLETEGCRVLTAENGLKALALMHEWQPRIVLSDWLMPKMDGVEVCRKIRALQSETPLYFIMLTVQAKKAHLLEAFDAGVDDFLVKPFDQEELLARLRAGVRIVRMYEQLNERAVALTRANVELSQLNDRLHELATVDELTGLFNRRQAMLRLGEHWANAVRYNRPLACAMIDIDHFKPINDRYGHARGDEVLQRIARDLRRSVRAADLLFRVGGEEFMILFPNQEARAAAICGERCRLAVQTSAGAAVREGETVTISLGVAERTPSMVEAEQLLRAADRSLYAAKRQGRNCTVICDPAAGGISGASPAPKPAQSATRPSAPADEEAA